MQIICIEKYKMYKIHNKFYKVRSFWNKIQKLLINETKTDRIQ